jgi:hypothetical protein
VWVSVRKVSVRSWWPLGVLLAVVAVSVGLACTGDGDTEGTVVVTLTTPTPTVIPSPSPEPSPTPSPTPTPDPEVCGFNPDPAPLAVLQVEEPQPGQRVKNPFHVRGWGSEIGFEDRGVIVALVDAKGDPLPPKDVPPQPRALRIPLPGLKVTEFTAPFGVDIVLPELRSPASFCIWVFLETTAEGVPKQVVQVPVVVTP